MKFSTATALGALFFAPAVAAAQTAPAAPASTQTQPTAPAQSTTPAQPGASAAAATPTVGATIYDSAGAAVGTIDQVTPQAVVVNVDAAKVALPPSSIGSGPQGLRIALTRAEVVAAAQQAQAGAQQQLMAQLTPGASVRGTGGAVVGTVKTADAQTVTLTTPRGDVQLPMSGFGMGPNGPVLGMTAAQLDAAIGQAGGGSAAATTGAGAATSGTDAAGGASAGATTGEAGTAATTETQSQTTTRSTRSRRPNR